MGKYKMVLEEVKEVIGNKFPKVSKVYYNMDRDVDVTRHENSLYLTTETGSTLMIKIFTTITHISYSKSFDNKLEISLDRNNEVFSVFSESVNGLLDSNFVLEVLRQKGLKF